MFSRVAHARLPDPSQINSGSEVATKIDIVDQNHRCVPAQLEKYRCRSSARRFHLCHRCIRLRKIHAYLRCALSEPASRQRQLLRSGTRRMQVCHRRASRRRDSDGRSSAARAHAAFDADSLSGPLRPGARIVRRASGSDGAGTDCERVLVQLRQRPLRTMLGHRFRKDRDAILERSLREMRGVRRPPFSTARVEGKTAREFHSRFAQADCERSDRVLCANR